MKMDPLAALFAVALAVIIILGMIFWQLQAIDNFYFPKEGPRGSDRGTAR
jgi:energy-converting hydrogenase Eha subunit F